MVSLEKMALAKLSEQVPNMKRGLFTKKLMKKLKQWGHEDYIATAREDLAEFQVRPDAYTFCDFCECVHTYEIEDTCKMDDVRLKRYINLYFLLDFLEIDLVVWTVSRYGHILHPINMLEIMAGLHASGLYQDNRSR
jgi:hypothetical protein